MSVRIDDGDIMDVGQTKKYSSKTKRDENGQYPEWMNQRAIKKNKKRLALIKKSKKKNKNKK